MNLGAYGKSTRDRDVARRHNPILFWNEVSLQLVALDHSIDASDARAPGPCASARALGLAHIVMADAVAAAYAVDYEGFYVRARAPIRDYPEVFVGGAAAWILEYTYSTPAHSQFIASQRLRFLDSYEPAALQSWEAGLTFARNEAFTSRWDWNAIRRALLTTPTPYVPRPRGHNVDPFNADQGFYGVSWGQFPTLDPQFGAVASYGPPEPPAQNDPEYLRDFEEVRLLGAWRPERPAPEQVQIGLFWAYDGARLIGTPPRLYNQIVRQIAEDDGMSVPEMARLLALCNLAMADAGIVAWGAKYRYGVWRPVVAIRQSLRHPSSDWRPFGSPRTNPTQFALGRDTQYRATAQNFLGASEYALPEPARRTLDYKLAAFTPNFPAYPSGHATFGSACFNILKSVRAERARTGASPDSLNPSVDFVSDELNGVSIDNFTNRPRPYLPQRYSSIDQMIEDNNRSRVHLGVHWNFDCERGAASGERVADQIYGNAYQRGRVRRPEVSVR
ncbi:MAG TPA: hypothetical protein VJ045_13050 [Hyphomicrobiaceae bacterium]|nr:hypothetical protein [Hyphomicrobiaceae bacterium]